MNAFVELVPAAALLLARRNRMKGIRTTDLLRMLRHAESERKTNGNTEAARRVEIYRTEIKTELNRRAMKTCRPPGL